MKIYLDNAASTMVRSEAIEAMVRAMAEDYGNPSSMHEFGRIARDELERARGNVAKALGAEPENIYFTSGGTEANNLAILGTLQNSNKKSKHIITSAIEHSAVKEPIKKLEENGWEATYLLPDKTGRIPTEAFSAALCNDTAFASIMLVSNETGAVNPVGEYASCIKQRGLSAILHTDAVQGLCKIPFTVKSLDADLVSVSSHKLHGPKGAGALYVGKNVKITPLILGGKHEKDKRGGTEALPAIVGFGEAVSHGHSERDDISKHVRGLRDYLIGSLKAELPKSVIIGDGGTKSEQQSPFILCISMPGYKSEVLMTHLDGEGICVSNSAACKKGARSPALEAMGLENDIIDGSLRISFSRSNTTDEVEYFVQSLKRASELLLKG